MKNKETWIRTGVIATIIIVISMPLYLLRKNFLDQQVTELSGSPTFVGKESCIECHKVQYELWIGSDHDLAMDHASDSTVLGDFNNA